MGAMQARATLLAVSLSCCSRPRHRSTRRQAMLSSTPQVIASFVMPRHRATLARATQVETPESWPCRMLPARL